jgi:hypothetical protein
LALVDLASKAIQMRAIRLLAGEALGVVASLRSIGMAQLRFPLRRELAALGLGVPLWLVQHRPLVIAEASLQQQMAVLVRQLTHQAVAQPLGELHLLQQVLLLSFLALAEMAAVQRLLFDRLVLVLVLISLVITAAIRQALNLLALMGEHLMARPLALLTLG